VEQQHITLNHVACTQGPFTPFSFVLFEIIELFFAVAHCGEVSNYEDVQIWPTFD
jgi:hypothetical protein